MARFRRQLSSRCWQLPSGLPAVKAGPVGIQPPDLPPAVSDAANGDAEPLTWTANRLSHTTTRSWPSLKTGTPVRGDGPVGELGTSVSGQVLVKDSSDSPWKVFEQTQSLRVQAIDSFPIPDDQGLGPGHSLLVTEAIVDGQSEIQWLLDGAESFTSGNSYSLASPGDDVRSFGAHESDGVWSVYAGARPTGILRGEWSPANQTLVFDPTPELVAEAPGAAGSTTQKVTVHKCGGALYVSISTKLFRRNDGTLSPGVPRWALVYQEPRAAKSECAARVVAHDGIAVSSAVDGGHWRPVPVRQSPTGAARRLRVRDSR